MRPSKKIAKMLDAYETGQNVVKLPLVDNTT
jgi:hypothetical protein